ncbi:RNA-protein complex protein Nop10 [Candidatus Woesearchaeota archaeon]|nr:RNA-protein complex protein Nop10 [Candidatus Woesearchaeota archaeon]
MKHILKCEKCEQYTMQETCPKCKGKAVLAKPAKWSPDDPYGNYRREAKKEMLSERGLI